MSSARTQESGPQVGLSPPPAVSASGLSYIFRSKKTTVTALNGISLDISEGGMSAFVGPDGAGKTTFMRLACGLLRPASGSLRVLGMDTATCAQQIQDIVSYMPQRFGLYEDLSVQENMDLYADLHGVGKIQRVERFARLLHMADLSRFTSRPAGKLSGGMKQKLALICTLVRSPRLLLLDEPSVGVDPLSRRELWEIVTQMVRDEKLTVIVSTSYMDEAARCGQVFILHEGRLLAQGTPDKLRSLAEGRCFNLPAPAGIPVRDYQSSLLALSPQVMDAVPRGGDIHFVLDKEYERIPCGQLHSDHAGGGPDVRLCRKVAPNLEDSFMLLLRQARTCPEPSKNLPAIHAHQASATQDETVIEVRNLVRRFGNFTAVDKTSFDVRRGEVFGLLGPNGAGKTTTFRMLCGLLPATSGQLCVAGEDLRRAPAQARAKVGYVSQKFSLYANLSVIENLRFFGGVYGMGPLTLHKRIEEILEEFDLAEHRDHLSGGLPGGYKQRLAMAAGLLHRPEILFLDEPTSGIDGIARRMFWQRITALSAGGTTIVITTHFMEEAEYCDRILIQDAGRALALGTPAEIRRQGGGTDDMEEAFIAIVEQGRAAQKQQESEA